MMLVHTVLMKTKPNARPAELRDLTLRIRLLASTFSGVGSFAVGRNVTEEPLDQGYSFGFILNFADHGALDAYHVNPAHMAVSFLIRDVASEILVFDIEN